MGLSRRLGRKHCRFWQSEVPVPMPEMESARTARVVVRLSRWFI